MRASVRELIDNDFVAHCVTLHDNSVQSNLRPQLPLDDLQRQKRAHLSAGLPPLFRAAESGLRLNAVLQSEPPDFKKLMACVADFYQWKEKAYEAYGAFSVCSSPVARQRTDGASTPEEELPKSASFFANSFRADQHQFALLDRLQQLRKTNSSSSSARIAKTSTSIQTVQPMQHKIREASINARRWTNAG